VFAADWAHRPFTGNAADLVLSPTNSRDRITALMAGAWRTLDVDAEEDNDSAQEDAMIAAAHRGVRVRVVCTGDGDVSRLRVGGVQVVVDKSLYIHAKAIVADGATVFIGSENVSATSLDRNREMGLILTDRAAVATVEQAVASDFSSAPSPLNPPPAAPVATSTQTAGSGQTGAFSVRASVSPNPMPYNSEATLTAATTAGASCVARAVYSTGSVPTSCHGTAQTVPASGSVSWSWHVETKGSGGTATVTGTLGSRTASASVTFNVTH
jgi:hypothetical protein